MISSDFPVSTKSRDDLDRPEDGPTDAARQPDDLAVAVADRADAVERPLDARAVVVAERADVLDDVRDVRLGDLAVEQRDLGIRVARLGPPAEVHDDLDQLLPVGQGVDRRDDLRRQRGEQDVEVVGRLAALGELRVGTAGAQEPRVTSRCRTAAGTRLGSATRTRVSFRSSVTVAISAKPDSSSRRSAGDS